MPAALAIWVWKILNVLFLVGAVRISLTLMFSEYPPNSTQRTIIWCFAFLLWPTSVAVFDGNTPLCVLFFVLLGLRFVSNDQPYAAGACLGFSLIKPNIVLPLFALLAAQRKIHALGVALVMVTLLSIFGIQLTGVSVGEYLKALENYNLNNSVTDSSSIGFAKLVAVVGGFGSAKARLISAGVGAIATLAAIVLRYVFGPHSRGKLDLALPLLLLLGIDFLGARGYDLVFVIPIFAWLVSLSKTHRWLTWPALLVVASLMVPQRAIELVYERFLTNLFSPRFFEIFLSPFRSWALLILLLLSTLLFLRLTRESRSLPSANH